jgi:hypothetical protein
MNGIKSRTKTVDTYFPYAFTECKSHQGKYAVYDASESLNAIVARGLTFDAARTKCLEFNGKNKSAGNDIETGDIYPCAVVLIGNDWKATNHITGETSEKGYQSYKEALVAAELLFSRWLNIDKCQAA